ncbi:MAG: acyl--CoA ligase [Aquiluna sp.]|nr:acyl--CoA ligase [Aquiluna sp.]MCF8545488.1 acyl--CoA ligase [Aquiluna sp.]
MTDSDFPALELGPVAHLAHWARQEPDAMALVGPRVGLSWRDLLEIVQVQAQLLRDAKISGGVLIAAQGETEKILALACLHEGLFFASLPPNFEHSELAKLGFTTIFGEGVQDSVAMKVLQAQPMNLASPVLAAKDFLPKKLHPMDLVQVVFTSGTTGLPKATPFSLDLQSRRVLSVHQSVQLRQILTMVSFRTMAGSAILFLDLWRGRTNLTPGSPKENLELAKAHAVELLAGSPALLDALGKEARTQETQIESVKAIMTGGAFIHPKVATRLAETFHCKVMNVYASTEGGLAAFSEATNTPNDLCLPYPGVQIKIVDEEGGELPTGQKGRILIKGPQMRLSYLGPEGFDPQDSGEYFEPGDFGYRQENGLLKVLGREDDILNLSGVKIDPRQIEEFAMNELDIPEAVSMLATDQHGKTFHILFVVSNEPINNNELVAKMRQVFKNKAPQMVMELPEIPRNEMGKVARRVTIETGINSKPIKDRSGKA